MQPLNGMLVLDFSTLLPGPMASLLLAEAGARVVKIERPGRGDEMRSYEPKMGADSVNFLMLNRGKQSISIDLKEPDATARLRPLLERADVLIEQFRPGVMHRLGLGYETLRKINPALIYCSITGWGQSGPKSATAGHDLNYMAETGVLGLSADAEGRPALPPVLAADIAGGAYPAVMNILLALRQRDASGCGTYIDVSMADNLFPFMYWGLGNGFATHAWPQAGKELVTGASPRYQIYRTADSRYLAAAPLEDKFWATFCELLELPEALRTSSDDAAVIAAVSARIAAQSSQHWRELLTNREVCCSIVASLEEAVKDPQVTARALFGYQIQVEGRELPALPVPIASAFRSTQMHSFAPALGETKDPLLEI